MVIAPRKDGELYLCVKYRKINARAVRVTYQLPCTDECIDSLGERNIIFTIDCRSVSNRSRHPTEADRDKTTFSSHQGLFRFTRMPLGVNDGTESFQRLVEIVMSGADWQFALTYLDEIFGL